MGQFDDAEAGTEMAAGHRHGVDGFLAEFVRDLLYLLDLKFAEVVLACESYRGAASY